MLSAAYPFWLHNRLVLLPVVVLIGLAVLGAAGIDVQAAAVA